MQQIQPQLKADHFSPQSHKEINYSMIKLNDKTSSWAVTIICGLVLTFLFNSAIISASEADLKEVKIEMQDYTDYALIQYNALNRVRDSVIISKLNDMEKIMKQNSRDLSSVMLRLGIMENTRD